MTGKGTCHISWLTKDQFKLWLETEVNAQRARFKLCKKSFDVSNMGEAAPTGHTKAKIRDKTFLYSGSLLLHMRLG